MIDFIKLILHARKMPLGANNKELKQKIFEDACDLYCINGWSAIKISEYIYAQYGVSYSSKSISNLINKNGWRKGEMPGEINKLPPKMVIAQMKCEIQKIAGKKAGEILDHQRRNREKYFDDMQDVVSQALALKKEILRGTAEKLGKGEIKESEAAKTIANLGLGALNIGKLVGISVDDNLGKSLNEVTNKDAHVKFYLPSNGREKDITPEQDPNIIDLKPCQPSNAEEKE